MKAFILASRPGDSCQLIGSWLWGSRVFRYEPKDWGQEPKWEGGQFDNEILLEAREYAPDVIIYIGICPHPTCPLGGIPSAATFHELRDIAPVVFLCGDGGCAGWRDVLLQYSSENRFDASITIDGCHNWPLAGRPNCWAEMIPITFPAELGIPPLAARTIPVSFCGESAPDNRIGLVNLLRDQCGLVLYNRDKTKENLDARPWVDYCRALANSRVTLNIPWCGSRNVKHVKARVTEAGLAGCCLLEMRGSETARWLKPGKDYAEYNGEADVVAVCRGLLTDLPRAQAMADSLRKRIVDEHSPRIFWRRALERVGVKWGGE